MSLYAITLFKDLIVLLSNHRRATDHSREKSPRWEKAVHLRKIEKQETEETASFTHKLGF